MKKLSYRRREYLDRRARLIALSGRERRAQGPSRQGTPRRRASDVLSVAAPDKFELSDDLNRAAVFTFFDRVQEGLNAGQKVRIDFGATSRLHPCGTLVLMANIEAWMTMFPSRLLCDYPKDEIV